MVHLQQDFGPTYWLTYSMELTGFQLVKKFRPFYWTQRFITAVTSALSTDRSIQSTPPTSHFLKIHLDIIFPSTPGSSKWSLSLWFPHQNPVYVFPLPHTRYMSRPSNSPRFVLPTNIWWAVDIINLLTPNVNYNGRTAPLTHKVAFYIFIKQI